jgi:hypothetical protein
VAKSCSNKGLSDVDVHAHDKEEPDVSLIGLHPAQVHA